MGIGLPTPSAAARRLASGPTTIEIALRWISMGIALTTPSTISIELSYVQIRSEVVFEHDMTIA